MSKELDALKKLKFYAGDTWINSIEWDIIETALKEHELMKEIRITARFDLEQVNKEHKTFEIIKECCEFDFIKKEENDKPIRYEIHIRRKGGDNIFFPCLAIYPKNQQEFDLLKDVLL